MLVYYDRLMQNNKEISFVCLHQDLHNIHYMVDLSAPQFFISQIYNLKIR